MPEPCAAFEELGKLIREQPYREGTLPDLREVIYCEQKCGNEATVYAMDSCAGGWGGRYCEPCAKALRFTITDRLKP